MPNLQQRSTATALILLLLALSGCSDDLTEPETDPIIPVYTPDSDAFHTWDPADFAVVLDVGPGQDLADPTEVPWESLTPSTLVRIHHRSEPYRTKWVINTVATADQPLVVLGVPHPTTGARPVISGDQAVTRLELNYWNEGRSVVKIGGSNLPSDDLVPAHIFVQGLEIRSGRPGYQFIDESGATDFYSRNAAAIHAEIGAHLTIENCVLTNCANGLFAGSQVSDLAVRGNHIHGNGIEGSFYEHNSYTECLGILFEYNRYGPLRPGCGGNNLKDRSAGTVIRYNWIEAGNRQLDLVETDHQELRDDPRYRTTFVYGNLLIETENTGNSQIVHYGGDGDDASWYRKGTLHFYHNTVYSTRSGNTTLLRLSTDDENADIRNCVVHATAGEGRLAIRTTAGHIALRSCWLTGGWRESHDGDPGGSMSMMDCIGGGDPGFVGAGTFHFAPAAGSQLRGLAGPLADAAAGRSVAVQYRLHQDGEARNDSDGIAGALGPD